MQSLAELWNWLKSRPCLLVGALTALVWAPSLGGGFLHDDYVTIAEGTQYCLYAGRLGHLAYFFVVGQTPLIHRAVLVLAHAANAAFVCALALSVTGSRGLGLVAGVLFGASYLVAEAVLFGPSVFWGLAVYASLLVLTRSGTVQHFGRDAASIALLLVALCSLSEGVGVVPVLVGLYAVMVAPRARRGSLLVLAGVLAVVFLGLLLLQVRVRGLRPQPNKDPAPAQ